MNTMGHMQCSGRKEINMFNNKLGYNLQFFAEGGDTTQVDTTNANNDNPETKEAETKTFDDILSDKAYQSEFDKRVAKALETAKSKWQTEYDAKIEDAKTEAQKLAKMNADQKAEYEQQKKLDELTKREKDINARELKAQAYETLAEKNLPKELIETLNFTDADSCNTSIEAVEKAFQTAVEKAVNEKLRGGNPPKGTTNNSSSLQEQIAKAMRGQI